MLVAGGACVCRADGARDLLVRVSAAPAFFNCGCKYSPVVFHCGLQVQPGRFPLRAASTARSFSIAGCKYSPHPTRWANFCLASGAGGRETSGKKNPRPTLAKCKCARMGHPEKNQIQNLTEPHVRCWWAGNRQQEKPKTHPCEKQVRNDGPPREKSNTKPHRTARTVLVGGKPAAGETQDPALRNTNAQ